ncbi:anti-sigma factor, partial [Mycobacterium sp. ITM-2017-0098]
MLTAVLERVSVRRGRARWMTSAGVGLAAAMLALALVIALRPETFGLHSGSQQVTAQMSEMTKVSETPINASVAVTGYGWGSRID